MAVALVSLPPISKMGSAPKAGALVVKAWSPCRRSRPCHSERSRFSQASARTQGTQGREGPTGAEGIPAPHRGTSQGPQAAGRRSASPFSPGIGLLQVRERSTGPGMSSSHGGGGGLSPALGSCWNLTKSGFRGAISQAPVRSRRLPPPPQKKKTQLQTGELPRRS